MNKKLLLLLLSLLSLFLFAVLSKYEDRQGIRNLDFAVTVKVQERIDKSAHLRLASVINNVMEGATYFAAPGFTSVAVILLSGIAFYDWKKKRVHWKSLIIPAGFVLIVLAELYGKSIVHHPSPPFSMIKHPTSFFPANYVNEQFSYPSGHAARAMFLVITSYLAFSIGHLVLKKRLLIVFMLGIYVFLVSISRIYLGEHWFSDVLGGLLLGSALGVLTWASLATYNR